MSDETSPVDEFDIKIEAEPVKELRLSLVGQSYTVRPPKGSLAIVLAKKMSKNKDVDGMMNAIQDWLKLAMPKQDVKKVMDRLEDPEDALDIGHITSLIEKLTERVTGNPTT